MRRTEWLLVGLVIAAFAPSLAPLVHVWRTVDHFSHGFLIPVVALFIASSKRAELSKLARAHDVRGLGLLAVAAMGEGAGLLLANPSLSGLSVVAAVIGTVWYLAGVAWLRVLAFPLGFLVFMVPLPASWLSPIIVSLQLWVSFAAVWVLRLFGFAILRDGNVMVLPGGESLFVAEACSGITSLVTLVPLGLLLAWYTERTASRRALLCAFVIPAALVGNLIRVIGTVWAADRYGVEPATAGFLHDWAGLFTYVLACGLLLGVGEILRRLWPPGPAAGAARS